MQYEEKSFPSMFSRNISLFYPIVELIKETFPDNNRHLEVIEVSSAEVDSSCQLSKQVVFTSFKGENQQSCYKNKFKTKKHIPPRKSVIVYCVSHH